MSFVMKTRRLHRHKVWLVAAGISLVACSGATPPQSRMASESTTDEDPASTSVNQNNKTNEDEPAYSPAQVSGAFLCGPNADGDENAYGCVVLNRNTWEPLDCALPSKVSVTYEQNVEDQLNEVIKPAGSYWHFVFTKRQDLKIIGIRSEISCGGTGSVFDAEELDHTPQNSTMGASNGEFILYLTSATHDGKLRDIFSQNLHQLCIDAASASPRLQAKSTKKALLSDWQTVIDAKSILSGSKRVLNTNGQEIISKADDIWTQAMSVKILDEKGDIIADQPVWTGSTKGGAKFDTTICSSWWSFDSQEKTYVGIANSSTGKHWFSDHQLGCDSKLHIYCIAE